LNPNYGRLRVWQNVVNSNYHALQASVRRALSHGLQLQVNYTFGHAIDNGSTWHSGATSANLNAAGEGFTTDQTLPGLDRGNSIFDVRHVLVVNYVWELPFLKNAGGVLGTVLGGWQLNGIVSFHTGAHWSAFCAPSRAQCDFNRDREVNDRPNSTITSFDASHDQWANGWGLPDFNTPGSPFSKPPAGSPGNLGRNTFVGARFIEWNPSIFKNFKVTERVNLQFRTEFFNALNHANFQLPGTNAPSSSASHGMVRNATFGQAGGTFNPRQLQFGLKLNF
jgi:hypothetical protein